MLTKAEFDTIPPGSIFRIIIIPDFAHPPVMSTKHTSVMSAKYIAVKGIANDWAMYYGTIEDSDTVILLRGAKLFDKELIKGLCPCTPDTIKLYRN